MLFLVAVLSVMLEVVVLERWIGHGQWGALFIITKANTTINEIVPKIAWFIIRLYPNILFIECFTGSAKKIKEVSLLISDIYKMMARIINGILTSHSYSSLVQRHL